MPGRRHSGSEWRFAEEPASSWPGRWATAANKGATALRAALHGAYRRCASRSDLWQAHRAAFPARTHRRGKREGETCHVERWFCTLRQRVSRLVRKALSFSECSENPLDAFHLFITTYILTVQQKATARITTRKRS